MRKPVLLIVAAAGALALTGCATDDYGNRPVYRQGAGHYDNGRVAHNQRNRQHNRGEYRLGENDRIYRDRNGNYYCKRSDGTTGAIIGALGGGVLGNIIAPGGSKTLGTILGAGGGLLAGRAIDRNNVRCR